VNRSADIAVVAPRPHPHPEAVLRHDREEEDAADNNSSSSTLKWFDQIGAHLRMSGGMNLGASCGTVGDAGTDAPSPPYRDGAFPRSIILAHFLAAFLDFLGFFLVHASEFIARLA
jgi:hypothetical protein